MQDRVSLQNYLNNMERYPNENASSQFEKFDLKTGMVVGIKSSYGSLVKYGLILENHKHKYIRYFTDEKIPRFDIIDSFDDETLYLNTRKQDKGGIYEVYANTNYTLGQTPFNKEQFDWAVQHGFYEKIWERNSKGDLVQNGTRIWDYFDDKEYIVSIETMDFTEYVSVINLETGERLLSEFDLKKGTLTFERLDQLLKGSVLFFYLTPNKPK